MRAPQAPASAGFFGVLRSRSALAFNNTSTHRPRSLHKPPIVAARAPLLPQPPDPPPPPCASRGRQRQPAAMAQDIVNDENRGGEEVEIEPDFSKKHPLNCRWTLWFDNPSGKQTMNKYGQTLRAVYTFDTVEDFWCLYNNVRTPSQLQPSATYYLFKEHIEPKWEDPKNMHGGCWTANIPKTASSKQTLDTWWLHSVLAAIGEQFTEGDELCGVAVNIRPAKDRVELWTRTAANEAAQTSIGKQFKQTLDLGDASRLGYVVFSEKLSAGSKAKDRYSV